MTGLSSPHSTAILYTVMPGMGVPGDSLLYFYSLFFLCSLHSIQLYPRMHSPDKRGVHTPVFSISRATGSSPIGNSIAIVQL